MTALDALDRTLRQLLRDRMTTLIPPVAEAQIGFRPPDSDWRTDVNAVANKKALNVYLLELRENRRLRTNERVATVVNGLSFSEPAPPRVDCHYLVTAWSAAQESAGKTLDEHDILGEALAVLMEARPLVPRRIFGSSFPTGFPTDLEDVELPLVVAPPEGDPKFPEFWGTLRGDVNPWKPAIHVVVTVPVAVAREFDGILVTTRVTTYRQEGDPGETLVQIAGTVRQPAPSSAPVEAAKVELQTAPAGELVRTTTTDELGRFTFFDLTAGTYRLVARAPGLAPTTTPPFDVPSPVGTYDISV